MNGASPVFGFLKQASLVDFPGHLAVVFFVKGCNFRCGFCHNPGLLESGGERIGWDKIVSICARFRDQWVSGAVISGGEPTLSAGLVELIGFLKKTGLAVKLDTNGSRPDLLRDILPMVDYAAMDIKTRLADYGRLTGFDDTALVAESVDLIKRTARDYEFRTTVIAGEHDADCIREMAMLISGSCRYVLQPFVPRVEHVDARFTKMAQTSGPLLAELAEVARGYVDEVLVRGG